MTTKPDMAVSAIKSKKPVKPVHCGQPKDTYVNY